MNHDPEHILAQLRPGTTDERLRSKVLDAIDGQLRESRRWLIQKRIGFCTLAMLIFGVGLNLWVNRTVEQRIAALFPPPTASRQVVELVAFISKHTDPQAGQWVYQQIAALPPGKSPPEDCKKYFEYLRKMADLSDDILRDTYHEKSEKNPALDGNQRGHINRAAVDCFCLLQLDHRFTA